MRSSSTVFAFATLACTGIQHGYAQESAVQIYGTLNVDFENVRTRNPSPASTLLPGQLGATPTGIRVGSRNRISQNSANIGFRGNENLGDGLNAFFQVESAVAVDVGGSFLASRNSAVGMQGDFGSFRIGQWDTPYKTMSGAVDPMYFTGIAYTGAIIGTPGFGIGPVTAGALATSADGRTYAAAANASFERRQGNVVQYWTPSIYGLLFRFAYAANESKSSNAASVSHVDPTVLSMSAQYEYGPVFLGYAFERHRDLFGLSALAPAAQAPLVLATPGFASISAADRGGKLVVRYTLSDTQFGLMWEELKYERSVSTASIGAFNEYKRRAIVVTLLHKVGKGTIRSLYSKAGDGTCGRVGGSTCDTAGLGAKQFSLGYSHTLSKRTDIYGFYTRVTNGARGSYQFANGAGLGAAPGSSSIGYVSGIRHTF